MKIGRKEKGRWEGGRRNILSTKVYLTSGAEGYLHLQ